MAITSWVVNNDSSPLTLTSCQPEDPLMCRLNSPCRHAYKLSKKIKNYILKRGKEKMANRKDQPKPQPTHPVFESYLIVPIVWNVILGDKLVIKSKQAGPGRALFSFFFFLFSFFFESVYQA
jgi:hypothetical protein